MKRNAKACASFIQRCHSLHAASHQVREQATGLTGNLAGWRLSRLMRDAETNEEVVFGEREYVSWLKFQALYSLHH